MRHNVLGCSVGQVSNGANRAMRRTHTENNQVRTVYSREFHNFLARRLEEWREFDQVFQSAALVIFRFCQFFKASREISLKLVGFQDSSRRLADHIQ